MPKSSFIYLCLFIVLTAFTCKSTSETTEVTPTEPNTSNPDTNMNYTAYNVPWSEIASFEKPPFDHRIEYGNHPLQFGELRLPEGAGPFPVVVFIHGGCWLSQFDLNHVGAVSADLEKAGYAVWTPEYRRIGDEGGGWTGTFDDAGKSVDYLRTLANTYPLDLNKVIVMGHSAGGHLSLWVAARKNLPESSLLYVANPLPVTGVIPLAPITDLEEYDKVNNSCSSAVTQLVDGQPSEVPERYREGSPTNLVPLGVPVHLVHGSIDNIVPLKQSQDFNAVARDKGDDSQVLTVDGAGHFDMVSPYSEAWKVVKDALGRM